MENKDEQNKNGFKEAMVQLFNNKNVIILMLIFGFIQGVFNTLGTVVGEIGAEYGFGPVFIFKHT